MRPAALVANQIRWEQKSFWRNPAAAAFTFAFPLVFLVIFAAINGNDTVPVPGGTVRFAQYYIPAIIAFGLISACYTNLAFTLSIRRDNGLLKRTRGTPLSPALYLGGVIGNVVVISLILTSLVIALGLLAYGVTFPNRFLALIVATLSGAFCFSALGGAVSTLVPNEDAAPAIINMILFPLLFISGTFGPIDDDSLISKIANVFPVRHLIQSMVDAFSPYGSGSGIQLKHVAVMAAWGVGGLLVAVKRFRWEPRR